MQAYTKELQALKSWDTVQSIKPSGIRFAGREAVLSHDAVNGTFWISTAGHGYLAVPVSHPLSKVAKKIVAYGFKGKHATYLEEDSEAYLFLKQDVDAIKKYRLSVNA